MEVSLFLEEKQILSLKSLQVDQKYSMTWLKAEMTGKGSFLNQIST